MKFTFKAIFISSLFLFSILPGTSAATAQEAPPVLAFYYAWFDQNSWGAGRSVDLPAEPYNSADRAAIERHVAQAQTAGIDALVQAWYGPQVENNQTETNFRALLEIGQARGLKAAVDFETTGPFFGDAGAVINGLETLLTTHVQHPAYLRYQGKPVIFFWRQQRFSIDEWVNIRNQVDPHRNTIWIAEGVDISYQAIFDGHHLYSIAWAGSPADQLATWGNRVRAYEAENGVERLWIATAMPGYNDTNLPRANTFAIPRRNGDFYRETWQGAVASQPDMVIITSFNEWPEGTHIEPSLNYGNFYLDLTRELVASWRGQPLPPPAVILAAQTGEEGSPQVDEGEEPPPQGEAETVEGQQAPPDGPYILTGSITNVRGGPATSFEIVGRLATGQAVAVIGRLETSEWWQIEFETGPEGRGWVAAEVVDFFGDEATVPVVEAPAPPPDETGEAERDNAQDAGAGVDDPAEPGPGGDIEADEAEATDQETITTEPDQALGTGATLRVPIGGANVRSGPGLNFELLGRLEQDTVAVVVARDDLGDWWQIEYEAGENGLGWVAAAVVDFSGDPGSLPVAVDNRGVIETPTPTPAGPVGLIEALDAINVRSEPSVEGVVLGGLYLGYTAEVLAISDDGEWWQIVYADLPGQPAWVSAEFVRFEGDRNRVPIFGLGTPTPTPGPTDTPTLDGAPIVTPIATPVVLEQPTFAPTATSIFEATSIALLAGRGTPDPSLTQVSSEEPAPSFAWNTIPWGILSILVIIGFFWYQFVLRRQRR
jgi:uncharacterized protein YraI